MKNEKINEPGKKTKSHNRRRRTKRKKMIIDALQNYIQITDSNIYPQPLIRYLK